MKLSTTNFFFSCLQSPVVFFIFRVKHLVSQTIFIKNVLFEGLIVVGMDTLSALEILVDMANAQGEAAHAHKLVLQEHGCTREGSLTGEAPDTYT